MTDMVDIYEAAGGKASEDRTSVTITAVPEPFDIVLRVVPSGVEMDYTGTKVTFAVLLDDARVIEGQQVHLVTYDESVTLPVEQVRIVPRE